jgi:Ni,Fe-hydrogenase I cytochrome b subunit
MVFYPIKLLLEKRKKQRVEVITNIDEGKDEAHESSKMITYAEDNEIDSKEGYGKMKKKLIVAYISIFTIISIFLTPYKVLLVSNQGTYGLGGGFKPIFSSIQVPNAAQVVINFSVLFVEWVVLTVIFAGLYMIFKDKEKDKKSSYDE